jgi:hypothetical protein
VRRAKSPSHVCSPLLVPAVSRIESRSIISAAPSGHTGKVNPCLRSAKLPRPPELLRIVSNHIRGRFGLPLFEIYALFLYYGSRITILDRTLTCSLGSVLIDDISSITYSYSGIQISHQHNGTAGNMRLNLSLFRRSDIVALVTRLKRINSRLELYGPQEQKTFS